MDELVGRLVSNCGIEQPVAEKAVGIILNFLKKEAPPEKVQPLIDSMPGAEEFLAAHPEEGGGMFSMGGVMGAGTKLMSAGLSMAQVQTVTKEIIAYAREKAGEDKVGEVVGAIPGLGQFV
jgi:hypothetical protein